MAEVPKSVKASLYIDGKPAESSLKNIRQVAQTLKRELDGLTVGTDAWNKKMLELQNVNKTLSSIQNEVKGVGGAFGWLRTEIGKLGALAVGYLGFQFISSQFQNIIFANAKLSDSLADIRRVAGLTEVEVRKLNSSFKDLDTRTSIAGLRDIAVIAGKLGVAKQDILGFVEATDKLVVTLGDELGNADQITTTLGKILNVFEGGVDGDKITKLGNAMVVMANAGVASGGFIAEFSQRVAGIAKSANLSLGATIGLAAGLEELGGRSESASTAVSTLLTDIAGDLPKAARIAKTPLEEFQKLFAEAPERALIKYAVGLTQNKQAFSDVSAAFKDAGEEGARVVATLSAIGNKAEFMQGKIDLAKESLKETSAINEGFAFKNETFGASVDKLSKQISSLTSNSGLTGFFQSFITGTSSAIEWVTAHTRAISNLVKMVIVAGVAWATYRLYLALAKSEQLAFVIATISGEQAMKLSRIATIALAGTQALLAGNFVKAAQAARLLNIALATSPMGAIIALVAAATAAYLIFRTTAANAQKDASENASKLTKAFNDQKKSVDSLTSNINPLLERYDQLKAKGKLTKDEQAELKKVITQIGDILPSAVTKWDQYGNAMSISTDKARKFIDSQKAVLKYQNKEAIQANVDARNLLTAERNQLYKELNAGKRTVYGGSAGIGSGSTGTEVPLKPQEVAQMRKRIKEIVLTTKEIDDTIAGLNGSALEALSKPDANNNSGGLAADASIKSLDKLNKKLEDLKKLKNAAEVGSKEFIKLKAEIKQVESEIAKWDGSAEKKAGKKEESEASKRLKEFAALGKEQKALNVALLQDQLSKNQKEVDQESQKYQILIDKEKAFLLEKGVTKEQRTATNKAIDDLEAQRDIAIHNLKVRQEADMVEKIKDLRINLGNLYETEYQKEINRINQFYDELERENAGNDKVLAKLKIARAQDLSAAEITEKKRLQEELERIESGSDLASANRDRLKLARINKKYDDEIDALKKKFSKEIQATQSFTDAINAINANRKAEIDADSAEKKKKITEAEIQGAQLVSDTVFQIGANNRRKESDEKLQSIEDNREKELSAKNLTEKQKDAINKKYDQQIKAEKLRAWKADKAAAQTQNVINTALAVTKALPNFILAGLAGAAGIAQGLIIASEPEPKFATGGYSDSDPAGYVSQTTLFRNSATGRPFVAGEAGREWIAPNWMLQNPRTANLIGMLEVARREKRTFAYGGFSNSNDSAIPSAGFDYSHFGRQNELIVKQNELLKQMTDRFDDFSKKPWTFPLYDFREENKKVDDMYAANTL